MARIGWRDWLGGSSKTVVAPRRTLTPFLLEGEELVRAVGESFYQPALLRQCGTRKGDAVRLPCRASLVAQPDNPYDRNAVAVQIGGQLVGHLSRSDAPRWQPLVQQLAARGHSASCEAMIAGRGHNGQTDNLGVFLHLPTPTEARAQAATLTA